MCLETLTAKDPQKASPFCLYHIVLILWESPKFDDMTHQLTNNKSANNIRAAMGSGTEYPIRRKAAKTAVMMRDVDINIDQDRDVDSVKMSDGSWMSALNDVKWE